jgi:putative spermidine/putrescine transport system permease protein
VSFSPLTRRLLGAFASLALVIIYLPLALVLLNSFNTSQTFAWPPSGLTTRWWQAAFSSTGARDAIVVSLVVALIATVIALVLGRWQRWPCNGSGSSGATPSRC